MTSAFERLQLSRPINKTAALHTHVGVRAIPLRVYETHELNRSQTATFAEAIAPHTMLVPAEPQWNGDDARQWTWIRPYRLEVHRERNGYRPRYVRQRGMSAKLIVVSKRVYPTMDAAKRVLFRMVRNRILQGKTA